MSKYKEVHISENGLAVLKRRYLLKDDHGEVIETPQEMFVRVASFVAEADAHYGADKEQIAQRGQEFYDIMADLDFLPNSPTLMNAGRSLGQLSACFVLPVGDSMEEIFETNKHAALIHKTGGGTGFSFSRLRPRNSIVASTSGIASGPVSFMKVFDASTEAVRQGGTRRGANMGILRVDHPDILEFISCKSKTDAITNFNISVGITDDFMQALANGSSYPLFNPHTGKVHEDFQTGQPVSLMASEVFDQIVQQAWMTGEPGIIFIDRMNRENPTYPHETIEATNPCGEQPLPAYDSCNLGSINLGHFVIDRSVSPDGKTTNRESSVDWERLGSVVRTAVHFLDNIIDCNRYPLPEIEKQTIRNRRIGLGVMGWADMLVRLGLPYNSPASFELAEQVMAFIQSEGHKHSSELAKSRGKFPNWKNSVYARENIAMRNATVTTVAPTGTISIIANCSSGIEPYYAIAFERNVMDGTRLIEVNPLFEAVAEREGFYTEELAAGISGCRSLSDMSEIPQSVRSLFLTAADIDAVDHIRMQAAFQKQCDSSVSKTINFSESATQDEVRQSFVTAYDLGCKGVTVYRDNSRPDQVLTSLAQGRDKSSAHPIVIARPETLSGFTEKIRTGYGNLYVTVNFNDGRPFEVFACIGKSGYTTMADTEAICRLISLLLRTGIDITNVIRQLRGIGGSHQVFSGKGKISSIPDAIAQVLSKCLTDQQNTSSDLIGAPEICPECNGAMVFQSGCFTCPFCAYSSC